MKIVINAFSAKVGGGRTYVANLLRRLPPDPALSIELFADPTLDIGDDARVVRLTTRWPVHNALLRSAWERLALPRNLRRTGADVLFCPGGIVNGRPPRGVAVVTMFRNMLPFDPVAARQLGLTLARVKNWLKRGLMLRSMARADLVIFISEFAHSVIASRIALRRWVVIPHGVSAQFRTAGSTVAPPPEAGPGPYLLYVSRFEPYKHHAEVIDAFAALDPALCPGLRLVLAGETDSRQGERARELVSRLGLEDRVVFLGGVAYDRLPPLYAHATAIVFASSCENCPNILLEAMGAGRPLLSSDTMPMPEFGGPELAYFDPTDAVQLTARMAEVLGDAGRAERLGRACAARSLRYDWEETAARTWDAILSLPAAPARSGVATAGVAR